LCATCTLTNLGVLLYAIHTFDDHPICVRKNLDDLAFDSAIFARDNLNQIAFTDV
jgi:hypothetical protein